MCQENYNSVHRTHSFTVCRVPYEYRIPDQLYFIVCSLGPLRNRCQVDVTGNYLGRGGECREGLSLPCRSGRREGRKENRRFSDSRAIPRIFGEATSPAERVPYLTRIGCFGAHVLSHRLCMTCSKCSLNTNTVLSPEGQALGRSVTLLQQNSQGCAATPVPHRSTSPCRFSKEHLHGFCAPLSGADSEVIVSGINSSLH